MQLKSWQKISLAAAIVIVPILSCGRRSLVLMNVTVAGNASFSDATLVITANGDEKTTFDGVALGQTAFRAGVYLPSDMNGAVTFKAEVDQANCLVGTGTVMADVSAGDTTGPIDLSITPMVPCIPITDGGTGGGGGSGTAGVGGAGNSGSGGTAGTAGGAGRGGSAGRAGNAGSGGRGGVGGSTSGVGGSGNKGGTGGTVSPVGTGGTVSPVGTGGSSVGGSTGKGGVGGSPTGTGGTGSTCICPANETCNANGACVCTQTDAQACAAAGIGCGATKNTCGQTVTCKCPASATCDLASGTCSITCLTGTGGSILQAGQAGTEAIICPQQ